MKIKAWGIEQSVCGADLNYFYWFASKEARDEYYEKHEYCDKIRCRIVDTDDVIVYNDYEDWANRH